MPWWPADRAWPTDVAGRPLLLLVQLNFAQMPALDPFPRSGLLQLFIGTNDVYGCDFELRTPTGFHVAYHSAPSGPCLMAHPLAEIARDVCSPLHEPLKAIPFAVAIDTMTVDSSDYRFETMLPGIAASEDLREDYFETVMIDKPAIRLGGYPTFTQTDPRVGLARADIGDFTLLTVDTTDGIMWGDSGVAQFFMHEADLIARDFPKVRYSWDCC